MILPISANNGKNTTSESAAKKILCGSNDKANIYKKVKDPNLVASLTGHSEGSKAFNRYREIDTEMKKELVSLLD